MTSNTVQVGVKCIRTSRIVNHDQNLSDTVGLFQKPGPLIAHLYFALFMVDENLQESLFLL